MLALHEGDYPNVRNALRPRVVDDTHNNKTSESSYSKHSINIESNRYFMDGELIKLFQSQPLSYVQYCTAAIHHMCDTVLTHLGNSK